MQQKSHIRWRIGAYVLIILSFFLRIYQLNNIAVEKAELMSIVWFIRRGFFFLLTHNKDLNNHPLNSLLAYLASLGNESLFTLRWHSVLIGVVTVAAVYRLARDWFGARYGFVAGLLMATSAFHVTLSQRSRGYVGLVGFTVLGFYFVGRAIHTGKNRYWVGFVLVSILTIYAHLYGVMAVAVVGLIALALLVRQVMPRRSFRKPILSTLLPLVLSVVAVYVISFGLYWPMLADTVSVAGQSNPFSESDLRHADDYAGLKIISRPFHEAIRPFSLAEDATRVRLSDPSFHYGPFDYLANLAEHNLGYYLSLGSFLLGLVLSWRMFRWQTSILLAWLVLPFVMQGVGNLFLPGAYYRGRFLSFIYPPYLIFMTCGWLGLSDRLVARAGNFTRLKLIGRGVGWLGVGALVLFNLAWLGTFYSAAINEHWDDVAHHISQNIDSRDVILCGQRPKTACNFDLSVRTGREVEEYADLITFENMQANRTHIEQPGRVWVVMPHLLPWQVTSLQERLERTNYWLAGNPKYDQVGWILVDSHQTLGDNLVDALQLIASVSLNADERYKIYLSLTQIHLARNQLTAAEESFAEASELLPGDDGSRRRFTAVTELLEYARQADQPVANLPPTAVQVGLDFGGMARLVAYEIDRQTISPGEALHVVLYWQPLAPIEQDLASYVHLTDRRANLLGQTSGLPASGQLPTVSWIPGQIVVDPYTVFVDTSAQTPIVMRVEAGLFNPENYEFIDAKDDAGQPVSSIITEMKVIPPVSPSVSPAHALNTSFAGLISLIGYDLVPDPPAIVLYWQAQASVDEDYSVFVHMLDANGQLVGQMDGQPLQGDYPTTWWSPGDVIVDKRSAPAVAPGEYRLLVGWYRLSNGSRLPLADGSGDSVTLDTINIP